VLRNGTGPPKSSPFERQQARKSGRGAATLINPEMHACELKGSARGAAACALEADGQTDLIIHAVIRMPAFPEAEGGGADIHVRSTWPLCNPVSGPCQCLGWVGNSHH
jgi:hypothetical protein